MLWIKWAFGSHVYSLWQPWQSVLSSAYGSEDHWKSETASCFDEEGDISRLHSVSAVSIAEGSQEIQFCQLGKKQNKKTSFFSWVFKKKISFPALSPFFLIIFHFILCKCTRVWFTQTVGALGTKIETQWDHFMFSWQQSLQTSREGS